MPRSLIIKRRFRGPPHSANGGYVAGRLAAYVGPSAEVTLQSPPPLDTALSVRETAESVDLLHGEIVVAAARAATANFMSEPPPDFAAAVAAAARTFPPEAHQVPGCFVCGPARQTGDGLRLQVGPLDAGDSAWQGTLAAPWEPPADLADANGTVRAEFVWAALDCPSAYACSSGGGMPPILLGRQTVTIERLPQVNERCIIVAQRQHREGRKYFSNAALIGAKGRYIAHCNAIWIEVTAAQLNSGA